MTVAGCRCQTLFVFVDEADPRKEIVAAGHQVLAIRLEQVLFVLRPYQCMAAGRQDLVGAIEAAQPFFLVALL